MKPFKLLTSLLFMALAAVIISSLTGLNFAPVYGVILIAGAFLPKEAGFAFMAVTREKWTQDVVELLFPNNDFALRSIDHTPFVLQGKVVHIPVAGAASAITKNRSSFPATVARRSDSDITYSIDTYRTDPTHVLNIENYELEYSKRQSVLGADMRALVASCMTGLLYNWGPAGTSYVKRTSGGTVAANLSGATGNRKAFHKDDLNEIKISMDENDVDVSGRVALLNARHYNELILSFDTNELTGFHAMADKANGVIGRYNGFDIMMRSSVLRYRGADDSEAKVDTQDVAYAADPTDRKGSLVWHSDCVTRAVGSTEMFDNLRDPAYYGDIYSFEQRLGGRIQRTAGVFAVVDAIVA